MEECMFHYKKKSLGAIISVLAIGLAAAACSSGSSSPSSSSSGHVTLTYWNGFTGPDGPTVVKLVNEFNQTHPNITIKMSIMSWDVFYEKLLPALAAGDGPNIEAMDTQDLPQYATKGVFLPLTSFYQSSSDTPYLAKAAVAGTVVDGTEYAVPANFAPLLLYWNKTLFAKAGLSGPPSTWAQWVTDLKKLSTGGSSPQYGIAMGDNNTIPIWPILLWENGGGIVNSSVTKSLLSAPATVSAVQEWANLIIKDGITPKNISGADADSLFQAQKAAMEVNGPWATTGYTQAKVDYGLAPVPTGPAGRITLADVVAMSINAKDSPAQVAAAETFFNYWNSKQTQIAYALGTGFVPTRTDVTAAELTANPDVALFEVAGSYSRPYELGTQYTNIETDTWEPAIERILDGAAVDPTLSQANAQADSYLSSAG
jgi:multiple sugar transport system substrate-binding protein